MKILFIADVSLENPSSGSEQVLHQQAKGLASEGMEVYAITRHAGSPSSIVRNVAGVQEGCYFASVKDLSHFLPSLMKYPRQFYSRFLQGSPFEMAICHQPLNSFSLLMMRKLQHIPLVYTFHSPSHEEYVLSHSNGGRLRNLFHVITRRWIEKFCLKRTKKIMVLSRYMEKKVHDIHAISPDRTVVNPGGVDLSRFQPPQTRELLKADMGLPEGKIHLLTIRNLESRMGIENLLKSICILNKEKEGFHLTIGGEGIERKNLENMIQALGLSDMVSMTGFIPPDLLPQFYGAADFFILPTRYLEGFGLVTPESMACGTPVLGTPVGGTNEILSRFDPQFLFRDTSAEAMAKGIHDIVDSYFTYRKQYDDLRSRCREYAARNYSWQRHTNQLCSIIGEVVNPRRKSFN
jgi:glycosyltransferase involved in cell wall biosynthesis